MDVLYKKVPLARGSHTSASSHWPCAPCSRRPCACLSCTAAHISPRNDAKIILYWLVVPRIDSSAATVRILCSVLSRARLRRGSAEEQRSNQTDCLRRAPSTPPRGGCPLWLCRTDSHWTVCSRSTTTTTWTSSTSSSNTIPVNYVHSPCSRTLKDVAADQDRWCTRRTPCRSSASTICTSATPHPRSRGLLTCSLCTGGAVLVVFRSRERYTGLFQR